MRELVDIAFRALLIVTAIAVAGVIVAAATTGAVHPAAALAIAVVCTAISVDAWRGG